ncbi:MAG: peptidase [Roseivirga sp.]|nr:peptidase [Roseivirga sp.]
MRKLSLIAILVFMVNLLSAQKLPEMRYTIDMTQSTDTFNITLYPGKLKEASTFQFASTAPGTYQTMNIGRLVSGFAAFDKKGRAIEVEKLSVNQYKISNSKKVHKLSYQVAETFDTRLSEYPIYPMAGSSLEEDHALINAHTLLGYFHGFQKSPLSLTLKGRAGWEIGTALNADNGIYKATDYDHAVDSPILLGKLTKASTKIADTQVEIYTYSQNDKISSERLLESMSSMLQATKDFLIDLPVDRYTFLYHFAPDTRGATGAWEHSYSSEYTLIENDFNTPQQVQAVTDIASHEFFHIVTPLNIHSEIVEEFNFVKPTPSVHLWLYEGVTEWASNMLLYRAGELSLEEYLLGSVRQKILVNQQVFNSDWSLKKLAEESFNAEGSKQYGNIYFKGSLIGNLLDIRLLELSDGKMGLRELLLDLIVEYGKGKPVSEATFFDDLAAMTYPEIREFFDDYVLDNKELPLAEYFAKVGIEIAGTEVKKIEEMTPQQQKLFEVWSKNLKR